MDRIRAEVIIDEFSHNAEDNHNLVFSKGKYQGVVEIVEIPLSQPVNTNDETVIVAEKKNNVTTQFITVGALMIWYEGLKWG